MKDIDQHPDQQSLPTKSEASAAPRIGFDRADELPVAVLPDEFVEALEPTLTAATSALHDEGARGPASRRLLGRDVQLGRAQLRFLESLRNVELQRYIQGKGSERRVRLLERLVAGQHRRLVTTIDTLARLECDEAAPVHVTAHAQQAAFVFAKGGK